MTTEQMKAATKRNGKQQERDWATDYDIFDPDYVRDPYPVWAELREKCPVAHTEHWGGSWMPTRYDDLFAIAQDFENFSSREILVAPIEPPPDAEASPFYGVRAPPISSDPPEHTWARKLLLPHFSIKAVSVYEDETRELANALIDKFIENGRADAAVDYAQQIPPRVIASMLGVPHDMADTFTGWVRNLLELGLTNPDLRGPARMELLSFLKQPDHGPPREADRRPHEPLAAGRSGGAACLAHSPARHLPADRYRRHRHHLEQHRLRPLAPRSAP